jgi:thiamine-phosphate pyrophosphorylase
VIDIFSWDVYLVTDRTFSRGRSTLEVVEAAAAGGVSVVQLREKHLQTRDFYHEGLKIRDFLRQAGIPFIVNDRIDLALALEADGVHIGPDDMPLEMARKILGPDRILGISIKDISEINENAVRLADYLAISPIFLTSTKPSETKPWGIDGLRRARNLTDKPLVAIGSMKLSNAREVALSGADCIAVVTAIVAEDDPAEATAALVGEVRSGKSARRTAPPAPAVHPVQ